MGFDGFYKVVYYVGDAPGRSVMYVEGGRMLGGNSAFAHIGTYEEIGDEITSELVTERHNHDPDYKPLLQTDVASLRTRGRAYGDIYRFQGGSEQLPGIPFRSEMTPITDEACAPAGVVGEGGLINGLYSCHIRMLDGVDGGNTGPKAPGRSSAATRSASDFPAPATTRVQKRRPPRWSASAVSASRRC